MSQANQTDIPCEQNDWTRLKTLFDRGLDLDPASRRQILIALRREQPQLADELNELWLEADSENPTLEALPEIAKSMWEKELYPPEHIGPFRILEELGSGGMAVVYKAEQQEPIKRTVALKLMPRWMCSDEYMDQFRREQTAIARIVHPNVAVVFDSGLSQDGRPYFAMEYLDGMPITRYCDKHRLTVRQRVNLFIQVCKGMAYAHRKGIIHLDIKPENVLVVERGGEAVPKIIDFGISRLEDKAGFGGPALAAGSLDHMAPEQVDPAGWDKLDTRGDVYGLGALLYRLLTGVSRLDRELAAATTVKEACQVIAQIEPLPASSRIAAQPETFTDIASWRGQHDPASLIKTLRDELDWILARAMAAEPERRYDSCGALIEELKAYLDGHIVKAVPPRRRYLLQKFTARHKSLLATVFTFFLLVTTALIAVSIAWKQEITARNEARAAQMESDRMYRLTMDIFGSIDPYRDGREATVLDLLQRHEKGIANLKGHPEREASLRVVLADSYHRLGMYDQARPQLEKSAAIYTQLLGPTAEKTLTTKGRLALLDLRAGNLARAETGFRTLSQQASEHHGPTHRITLTFQSRLAEALEARDRLDEAQLLFESTLTALAATFPADDPILSATRANFGKLLMKRRRYAEAEQIFRENLSQYKGDAEADPTYLSGMHSLAFALQARGHYAEAEPLYQRALDLREPILGRYHPDTLMTRNNLAILQGKRDPNRALALLDPIVAKPIPAHMADHPVVLKLAQNRGHFLMVAGRAFEAETVLREVWRQQVKVLGAGHTDTLITQVTLGEALMGQGRYAAALPVLSEAVEIAGGVLGWDHADTKIYQSLWLRCQEEVNAETVKD